MADRTFDGKRVSQEIGGMLDACRAAGVSFQLNSGRRTMAEQWYLYNNQPPVAAYPNANAPHIREGRWDHAIDVNDTDNGADRVQAWAATKGVRLVFTVAGESWHLEVQGITAEEMRRKFAPFNPFDYLADRESRLIKELADLRAVAARRGKWLVKEKARGWSIKAYLKTKITYLKNKPKLTDRERKRLNLLRDAVAGRVLKL